MGMVDHPVDDDVRWHVAEAVDCVFDALDEVLEMNELRALRGLEFDNKICEGAFHDVVFDLNSALDHIAVMINASGRPLPIKWALLDKKIREKQCALEHRMVEATTWLRPR